MRIDPTVTGSGWMRSGLELLEIVDMLDREEPTLEEEGEGERLWCLGESLGDCGSAGGGGWSVPR